MDNHGPTYGGKGLTRIRLRAALSLQKRDLDLIAELKEVTGMISLTEITRRAWRELLAVEKARLGPAPMAGVNRAANG